MDDRSDDRGDAGRSTRGDDRGPTPPDDRGPTPPDDRRPTPGDVRRPTPADVRGDGAGSGQATDRTLLVGGGLVGAGVGSLVDVAVFHHVLQWHHLLSSVRAPTSLSGLRWNLLYDGLFSLAMLVVAIVGATLVWRAANRSRTPRSSRRLLGSVLVGAGAFNVFDGVVDHYLLGVHDVVQGTRALNPHWIGASLLLLGVGLLVLGR